MQKPTVSKWLLIGLIMLVTVQSLWIFKPARKPDLSTIISSSPVGKQSAVYEVLSNAGGATVPLTYLYFIAPKQPDETQALKMLEDHSPFLVTRQANAIKAIDGFRITARTQDTVYSYTNSSLVREDSEIKPVTIDLTATSN